MIWKRNLQWCFYRHSRCLGEWGGEVDVSFIFTSDTSKYSSLSLPPKYLCCTVTVTSFSLSVWVQKKTQKNLGVHYDKNGGIFMREVGGRNHQEVALRTPLMIHSDPRCGRC